MATAFMPPAAAAAQAVTASRLPLGLYESPNNLQYGFPVTPQYAIQYYGWQESFKTVDAQAAWKKGTEAFIELQSCGNPCDPNGIPISKVINGTYDSYLKSFATEVKNFNHPVLITFDHEMNGGWYPWGHGHISTSQWIAAWKHVTNVMAPIAPKAEWVWAPNIEQGAVSVKGYWPGSHAHVKLIGLDGYYQNKNSTWANTFAKSVSDVKSVSGHKYSFIVSETGVPSGASNKLDKIDNLVSGARSAHAKALMYFDAKSMWILNRAEENRLIRDVR
jgi:mannan endo-1,4-beta-mannosidase